MSDCRQGMLLLFLLGSAVYDMNSHKIPNWLILEGFIIGIGISCWDTQPLGWCYFLLRVFLTIGILFVLFLFRVMGAGDIKLMGLLVGYMGLPSGAICISYGFLIGAILALCKLLWQRSLLSRLQYFYAYVRQTILTKEITAYHDISRDGFCATIHFSIPVLLGFVAYLIQQYVI